jgi:hypothetical protein
LCEIHNYRYRDVAVRLFSHSRAQKTEQSLFIAYLRPLVREQASEGKGRADMDLFKAIFQDSDAESESDESAQENEVAAVCAGRLSVSLVLYGARLCIGCYLYTTWTVCISGHDAIMTTAGGEAA